MRSMWSGAISFGLVNIPIKLYSASGESSLDLDMLAKKNLAPIRYAKINTITGEEVDFKEIVKGYEIDKGKYVVLEDKDFEQANARKTKAIEIKEFVSEEEIDPLYYEKPYFLEPDKFAEKPYALLREALRESKKVGIGSFVLRNREHICALKSVGDVIILNQLRYYADLRDYRELKLPPADIIGKGEKSMALKLIDQLTEKFQPEQFKDTYIDELKKIIEAKAKGLKIEVTEKAPEPTQVRDLMETLKASLSASKEKVPENRAPEKKKAAEKKPAAKRKAKKE